MDTPTIGRPADPHGVLAIVHDLADQGMKPKEILAELTKRGKKVGISTIYIYLRTPREATN